MANAKDFRGLDQDLEAGAKYNRQHGGSQLKKVMRRPDNSKHSTACYTTDYKKEIKKTNKLLATVNKDKVYLLLKEEKDNLSKQQHAAFLAKDTKTEFKIDGLRRATQMEQNNRFHEIENKFNEE